MIASKEEERKALEKIRQIVEGLGPDSYVAAAFDGCFEMAEENIANDWGCSWKSYAEHTEHQLENAKFLVKTREAAYEKMRDRWNDEMKKRIHAEGEVRAWKSAYEDMQENLKNLLYKMAAKHSELIYNEHFEEGRA